MSKYETGVPFWGGCWSSGRDLVVVSGMEGPWRLSHRLRRIQSLARECFSSLSWRRILGAICRGVFPHVVFLLFWGLYALCVSPCCLPSFYFSAWKFCMKNFSPCFLCPKKKKGFSTLLNLGDTKRGTYRRSLVSSRKWLKRWYTNSSLEAAVN